MRYIKEFDGLRGLLALWVLGAHVIELGPYWAATRHLHANFAVDLFIILSGFVIFHLLSQKEDYATFITRRFFRLFPVFVICCLVSLALRDGLRISDETAFGITSATPLAPHLAAHATMLHGLVPEQVLPRSAQAILPPAWSISVEWQFYLLAPFLFAFAMRPGWRTAGLVVLPLIAVRLLHDAHALGVLWPGGPRDLTFDMKAFLPLKLELFAVGALSFFAWRKLSRRGARFDFPFSVLAFGAMALVFVATRSVPIALWTGGMLLLVDLHFGHARAPASWLGRFFLARPARFLGEISYCVYLLHLPLIVLVGYLVEHVQPGLPPLLYEFAMLGGTLALTIPASWLLHRTIERPFIEFGKRLTGGWKTRLQPKLAPASGA